MPWTTETDAEFQRFLNEWSEDIYAERRTPALPKPEPRQDRGPIWLWWGLAMLVGATFWAVLAVFCWGGNLLPRW